MDDVVRVTGGGIYIDFQQPDGTFTQEFFQMSMQNQPSWSICAGDIDGNDVVNFDDLDRMADCWLNDCN